MSKEFPAVYNKINCINLISFYFSIFLMNTFVWLQEMQLLQKRGQRCEILDQVENWYTGRLHFTGTLLSTLLISVRKIEK
jgi:hypothetical protein